MGGMKEAALECASRHWAVFPLVERDKVPAVAGGFKVATTDAEQIALAWDVRPDMNVGIATGGPSRGLVVIDLDVDDERGEDGVATLRAWEAEHGELPETVSAVTGRGGLHLYYLCNTPVGCSVDAGSGVDVRGEGGYVVAPPSVHPNGRAYCWETDPSEAEVARADDNVLAFIRSVQGARKPKERMRLPDVIAEGSRNDTLMRYASSMQARGDDDVLILSALEAANKLKCRPPLAQDEIEGIVESVTTRYAKGGARGQEERACVSLMRNSKGGVQQTIENCARALSSDPALAGRFFYDARAYTRMVELPLPWDAGGGVRALRDSDYCGLAAYMEREYGLMYKSKCVDAAVIVCEQNKRNLVAEWLDSLEWDGRGRVDTLLACYLGCEPTDYNMAVTRLLMLGAVARAYEPGCKFDYMPVLIGRQGLGKSMFLRRLGVRSEWYCDNFNTLSGDEAAEKLRGIWIAEMAELLATKRQRDVEGVKAFLTSMVDTIRPKYARETEQRPRACVFCGTTNDASFLTDATGNRRFLPVECGVGEPPMSLFADDCPAYFEQAWAEAARMWLAERPPLVLEGRLQGLAVAMQERYLEDDPRVGMVQAYLDERVCEGAHNGRRRMGVRVCVQELIDKALPDAYAKQASRFLVNEVHKIMQHKIAGWEKYPSNGGRARCGDYGFQRCYVPTEEEFESRPQEERKTAEIL